MAFSEKEKAEIRHHLGYPSWSQFAASIQLGIPSGSQPLFILESAFGRILPDGEEQVRRDLCECNAIEQQLSESRRRFKAAKLGELQLQDQEPGMLRQELEHWTNRLADDLGVVRNPYGQMAFRGMPGGRNAQVVG